MKLSFVIRYPITITLFSYDQIEQIVFDDGTVWSAK